MLNALKLARPLQQKSLTSFPLQNSNHIAPSSAIRFASSFKMDSHKQKQREPDSKKQTDSESKTLYLYKIKDSMSSYGEGYASRSDEEGFGGIYGEKQYVSKGGEEKAVQDEFDHNQGSHVKEEENEKARHQTSVD
ncbi:hypothetical protein SASPL_143504 [Salvia splendens]|uniref:Uncharacterized protein n=1 Tax=Salvia splendens TaxID=180675 RepID=A0A8X8ZAF2_SALSN|nr:hypothetical protein SASPL_143504 [Salvia splendens]